MKRGRAKTLTGGSGDVKPQIWTAGLAANPAAGQYVETGFVTPIPRAGFQNNRAAIMEILQIHFYNPAIFDQADVSNTSLVYVSTRSQHATGDSVTTTTLDNDTKSTFIIGAQMINNITATSGAAIGVQPFIMNLNDGNGNGVLVATDTLYVGCGNVGGTTLTGAAVKILYRIYDADLAEYVGIVQSQQ